MQRTTSFRVIAGIAAISMLLAQIALTPAATASLRDDIASTAVELDRTGFETLKRAIGDARIVMLGEPWHGDGAAIAERVKLVEFLHQEMDFDILVMEADFYALHRSWELAIAERDYRGHAARNMYAFWGRSAAAAPLWAYVERQLPGENPLIVAGMDTKVVGHLSRTRLHQELLSELESLGVDADTTRDAANTFQSLVASDGAEASHVTEGQVRLLMDLVDRLAESSADDTTFRGQLARSLKSNLSGQDRDIGMAENLIWLATRQYPDRKLIVWAHNNHILLDKWALFEGEGREIAEMRGSWPQETLGRKTYVGEAVRHHFGPDAVYALATVTYTGRYSSDITPALLGRTADFNRLASLEPAPTNTLEAALHRAGRSKAFVDLRAFKGSTGVVSTRAIDYSQTPALPFRLWDGYDGLLYLDRTHGLEQQPFESDHGRR